MTESKVTYDELMNLFNKIKSQPPTEEQVRQAAEDVFGALPAIEEFLGEDLSGEE